MYLKNKQNLALMTNYSHLLSLESEMLFPSFSPIVAFLKCMYRPGQPVPCESTKCYLNVWMGEAVFFLEAPVFPAAFDRED